VLPEASVLSRPSLAVSSFVSGPSRVVEALDFSPGSTAFSRAASEAKIQSDRNSMPPHGSPCGSRLQARGKGPQV